MNKSILKSKSMCLFAIALFAISLLPNIALGATQLPDIRQIYGSGLNYIYQDVDDTYLYTGKPLKPKVHIGYSPNELVEGHDYVLSYKNNINVGKATVIATGIGNYTGQSTYEFYIEKIDISDIDEEYLDIYLADDDFAYTGNPIMPKIISKRLKQGIDYDVAYTNNVNPGKGVVLITGKGSYCGTRKLVFKIKRYTALNVRAVYNGTRKIVCTVDNPAVGDSVKLKIGIKTYTKKIKKAASHATFKFKVPKQKYGKKYTITIRSKTGTTVKKKTTRVWYTNKLRIGQTKTHVLYNPNWGSPSYKNVYSGYSGRQETWAYEYYDSYGNWYNTAYLYFRNGKLTGWTF